MNEEKKIALIIDCDNVSADAITDIMRVLSPQYGETNIRRAYGNFAEKSSAAIYKILQSLY